MRSAQPRSFYLTRAAIHGGCIRQDGRVLTSKKKTSTGWKNQSTSIYPCLEAPRGSYSGHYTLKSCTTGRCLKMTL